MPEINIFCKHGIPLTYEPAINILFQVNYVQDKYNRTMEGSAWCGIPFDKPDGSSQLLLVVSSGIFFVLPMTLILILYLHIALALHRSSMNQSLRRSTNHVTSNNLQQASPEMPDPHPNHATNHILERNTSQQRVVVNNVTAPVLHPAPSTHSSIPIGKRRQAEMAHMQSRRAVIKMLGNFLVIQKIYLFQHQFIFLLHREKQRSFCVVFSCSRDCIFCVLGSLPSAALAIRVRDKIWSVDRPSSGYQPGSILHCW